MFGRKRQKKARDAGSPARSTSTRSSCHLPPERRRANRTSVGLSAGTNPCLSCFQIALVQTAVVVVLDLVVARSPRNKSNNILNGDGAGRAGEGGKERAFFLTIVRVSPQIDKDVLPSLTCLLGVLISPPRRPHNLVLHRTASAGGGRRQSCARWLRSKALVKRSNPLLPTCFQFVQEICPSSSPCLAALSFSLSASPPPFPPLIISA